jgi:prlF antitoxin for toxin YhaV_toxin
MPTRKDKATAMRGPVTGTEYRGKQTKTGNSSGFRFEGALFKSHPEFNGEVTAHVIAPGRMLVTAERKELDRIDPVMTSFLAFLAQDIAHAPQHIRPLDSKLTKRMDRLTKGIHVSPSEDLGDEDIL